MTISKPRDSSIELFRIITMLVIVAHHSVVNSGLQTLVEDSRVLDFNTVFALLFGWGGKTGINCFVLITGYFMCKSQITVRKFLKLMLWMEFYKVILFIIFAITGYQDMSINSIIKSLMPVSSVADGFGSAYLVFYLFIPFLNILINAMNKRQHILLVCLCIGVYMVLSSLGIKVVFNYVTWFSVIYILGAYIRMYPEKWFNSIRLWGTAAAASVLISWLSVMFIALVTLKFMGHITGVYFFVADSNKVLAVITAVCAFMFFKNLNIGYSRFINTVAASAYGVLLIHANSDAMRQWLWKDTLNVMGWYKTALMPIYAICAVIGIYAVCTVIDMLRIKFIEIPFFGMLDKKIFNKRG
jgi:hypothetical protein